jgi:hypothetical protein
MVTGNLRSSAPEQSGETDAAAPKGATVRPLLERSIASTNIVSKPSAD